MHDRQLLLLTSAVALLVGTAPIAFSSEHLHKNRSADPLTIVDQNGRIVPNARPGATSQIFDVTVAPGGALQFSPGTVNIAVGDTVRWTWGASGHNVRSGSPCTGNGSFCSPSDINCTSNPTSSSGAMYSHTFSQAGTFSYFCSVHCGSGMTGIVVVGAPTVTNVAVISTSPDNGLTPYNTGTATLRITGTVFASVGCPGGVALDDPAATQATACTVDSDTQITATFPAGISTNGSTGWNVRITNNAGTNATSAVKFVPRAGLLISEVCVVGASGNTREFVEVYNPTATAFSVSALGLHLHIRNSTGTSDGDKLLTLVTTGNIPAHGFLLFSSNVSTAADPWFSHRDYTYSASADSLVSNGGVYISLSSLPLAQVLDKVGWGTQASGGFEGVAMSNIGLDESAQRTPGGGLGHGIDTDNNANDFVRTTSHTPLGSADPVEPPIPSVIITSASRQTNGHFIIDGQTSPGVTLTIRVSPDLLSSFTILGPTTADGTGAFQYDDAGAVGLPMRFYRATYP